MDASSFDRHMMAIALRMAKRGLGTTAPNPSVGAVVADPATGEVAGRGWTQPGGRPHAETEALRRAGARAAGATMYVTLEPCAHHGQTPPCADAIAASGVKRVVIGIEDPDPRTAGGGIERLGAAGLEVATGVLAEEARWVSLGHILRVAERRPFVQVKMALDADGSIARGRAGQPVWVTGPEARAQGHLLRAEADAILVGARTVADDDPELTCRLPGLEARSPVRVVLSCSLDMPVEARLIASARAHPVWVFCGAHADPARRALLEASGAEVMTVPSLASGLSLPAVMEALAARGITRLLVEGGPTTWRAFSDADLVDEVVVFQACSKVSDPQGQRLISGQTALETLRRYVPTPGMTLVDTRRIGEDLMHVFRPS